MEQIYLIKKTLDGLAFLMVFAMACPCGQYTQFTPVNSSIITFLFWAEVLTIVWARVPKLLNTISKSKNLFIRVIIDVN